MIFDTLTNSSLYTALGPRLARGFEWLANFKTETPEGRYAIDGDAVYALVQGYETVPATEKKFESHRSYLDIQYMVEGSEVIYYASTRTLKPATPYDSVKDFLLYSDPADSTPLLLRPGTFAVFYPNDGHKGGCADGTPARVRKVVVKVQV
jgi:biofilm protein TabA